MKAGALELTENQSEIEFKPRIMIVDDNPSNISLLTRILNLHGYTNILPITDSGEVIDQFKKWQPDIILLDLLMPRFNGLDILDQINSIKNKQYLPVIMITADDSMDNRVKALKMGANDYISKPFNPQELIARIENLIIMKKSMDQALATETAFLQAQIKPHFLFNTLNTISSFCDTDPERASCLIDDFARYLRQSFDFKSTDLSVPVEREMQLVNSFVEIQKARFTDRIHYEVSNDSTQHFYLPPLCIQPLVENAILHGLKKNETISVALRIIENCDGIVITVEDDGPGIPQDKLDDILLKSDKKGIGLWNIDTRLKKFFGTGLSVFSRQGTGTKISFRIPKEHLHETGNYR